MWPCRNLKIICPNLAQYIENSYKQPTHLYISNGGGEYISSQEGTTQGDNIAMAFYAISTCPIIEELQKDVYYELEKMNLLMMQVQLAIYLECLNGGTS